MLRTIEKKYKHKYLKITNRLIIFYDKTQTILSYLLIIIGKHRKKKFFIKQLLNNDKIYKLNDKYMFRDKKIAKKKHEKNKKIYILNKNIKKICIEIIEFEKKISYLIILTMTSLS